MVRRLARKGAKEEEDGMQTLSCVNPDMIQTLARMLEPI